MAKDQSALTNWTQYLALRLGAMALHVFDVDENLRGARGVGSLMYKLDKRHRVRGITNLRRCFPHMTEAQAAAACEQSMQHFLQLGVEVMFTTRLIHHDTWHRHIELRDIAEALEVMIADRPSILVTGHFGNWELLGYALATFGLDMDALARPIDNPLIDRWLTGVREKQGMRLITKWGATDRMTEVMQTHGTLGFIGDQNAGPKGMFVPFFGRLASAYKSIGLLAMTYDAPIVCGYAHRLGPRFRYEIGTTDVIYPEDWADQPDPLYYITARYTRGIEKMVRLAPEQYLWIHRRWKSRPRHETLGKPLPKALRRKLEQLPWMTDELMREVEKPVENPDPR